jgi:hypothetical protein
VLSLDESVKPLDELFDDELPRDAQAKICPMDAGMIHPSPSYDISPVK